MEEILKMKIEEWMEIGKGKIGKRDVFEDGREVRKRGGEGEEEKRIKKCLEGIRVKKRNDEERIERKEVIIEIIGNEECEENGGMVIEGIILKMFWIEEEIRLIKFREGKVWLKKIILSKKVGILKEKDILNEEGIGIGLKEEGNKESREKRIKEGKKVIIGNVKLK